MVASILIIHLLGVLLALIGVGLMSVIVVIAAVVPSAVYTWYCSSAGLDTTRHYAKITPRRRWLSTIAGIAMACAWIAAIGVHMTTGTPVFDVGLGESAVVGSSSPTGLITGGIVGGTVAALVLVGNVRRGRKRNAADESAADVD